MYNFYLKLFLTHPIAYIYIYISKTFFHPVRRATCRMKFGTAFDRLNHCITICMTCPYYNLICFKFCALDICVKASKIQPMDRSLLNIQKRTNGRKRRITQQTREVAVGKIVFNLIYHASNGMEMSWVFWKMETYFNIHLIFVALYN